MRIAFRFFIVILFLALVLGGIFGYKFDQFDKMQARLALPQPPAVISATKASTESWLPATKSVGSIVAVNGIRVANEVPGVIEEINFDSGDTVRKDDVLVRLNSAIDEAALRTRRAEAQLAEQALKRVADLLPKRAVSQSQFDESKANFDAAQARVNEAEAQLSKKIIRAPFNGTVGLRMVDQGQYLPTGSSIVEINMLDPIFVDYTIPEKDLADIKPGYDVLVTVAAVRNDTFPGKVSAINSSISPETRTVRVRATIANTDQHLKPGMFATVMTRQPAPREVITVPRTAISYNTYGDFVFLIVADENDNLTVKRQTVATGATRDGRVAVISGLKAGEQVVSKGLLRLRAGQKVSIQDPSEVPGQGGKSKAEASN